MIVLCPEKNFIYVPQSKVANTSILTAIATATGHPSLDKMSGKMLVELDWHRLSYDELYKSSLFKFAFVRNPWDRIVSCYNDKIFRWKGTCTESPHFKVSADWSFEQFVEWVCSLSEGDNYYNDPHFVPQHIALCQCGRLAVDYIGRFERIEQDWRSISLRFGLGRLPPKNVRPHPHYNSYFDGTIRAAVDRFYRKDIELFGYEFEER